MTEKQIKYVRNLMAKEGISFLENEYAMQFSNGRTQLLEDLNHNQTTTLINSLVEASPADKMKGKLLSMAHEMRWELKSGKVDMDKLNAWLIKYTPHKKTFNMLQEAELPMVVSVFEKMYKNYLKTY